MNAGDFITSLATMAGIPTDNEDFVKVMANKELATADFPDGLASGMLGKLLTQEAAKNNSDIAKHFKAEALNAVDGKLLDYVSKYELGDEFSNTLKNTQGSYNKMDMFTEALNKKFTDQLEVAKTNTDDPKIKEKLQEHINTINGLNTKLSEFQDSHVEKSKLTELTEGYEELIMQEKIGNLLGNYDYALPTSKDVNIKTAFSLLENAFTEKGVKVVNDEGILKLRTSDDMEYFDKESKKVSLTEFVDSMMADHKLLKVSDPTKPATIQSNGVTPVPITIGSDAPKGLAEAVQAAEALTHQFDEVDNLNN